MLLTRNVFNGSSVISNDIENIKIMARISDNSLIVFQLMKTEIAMIKLHPFLSQIKGLPRIKRELFFFGCDRSVQVEIGLKTLRTIAIRSTSVFHLDETKINPHLN